MAIHADTLLDRIRLKEQLTRWRILAILFLVVGAVICLETLGGHKGIGNSIARITIEGVIMDDPKRDEMMKQISKNNHIKALIVKIDSPGGEAVGGLQLYNDLRDIAKKKPVVAIMRSMATSAGYMTALGSDHIIANEGTITGSIGVIMQMAEFSDLAQKLGITPITIKSAPLKGSPSPLEKLSPEGRAALQDAINDFYQVFVNLVAQRRNLPKETVLKLSDGRIYSGRQALDNKLVDELGNEKDAIRWLASARHIDPSLPVQDMKPKKDAGEFFDEFTDLAGKNPLKGLLVGLDGLVLIWHPKTL